MGANNNRLLPSGVSYLPQHTVTQKRGIALALAGKGDDLFREEFSIAFGFVARLRILQTSSSAVDIAWMSCGLNTLPSRYRMMVMVLPRVCRRDNEGNLSCTKRPRPLFAGDGLLCAFWGAWRARTRSKSVHIKALSRPGLTQGNSRRREPPNDREESSGVVA